jgi:ATP-dependent DNA helicase Q1
MYNFRINYDVLSMFPFCFPFFAGSDGMQFITVEECGNDFLAALADAIQHEEEWDDLQAIETEACGALNNIIDQECSGGSKWVETHHVSPTKTTSGDSDLEVLSPKDAARSGSFSGSKRKETRSTSKGINKRMPPKTTVCYFSLLRSTAVEKFV